MDVSAVHDRAEAASNSARRHRLAVLAEVDHAFQPIVGTTSLRAHGYEALARLPEGSGYRDILHLLDDLADHDQLLVGERSLLRSAMTKFARFPGAAAARLFCNVDNRVFDSGKLSPERLVRFGASLGLSPANICIELNERQRPRSVEALERTVAMFLRHNVRFAIDDFGQGVAGLDTLMRVDPHYLKLDRAFIDGLASDPRKQAIVSKMAGLSHSLGLLAVAEGVEREADFLCARTLGCDLAQGFLIARPTQALAELRTQYGSRALSPTGATEGSSAVESLLTDIQPLHMGDAIEEAVERFRSGSDADFIPVVDEHEYVHGAVFEQTIRSLIFGEYGASILSNRGLQHQVEHYVERCPVSELTAPTESIVDSYVVTQTNAGVIVTHEGRYRGVLSNNALLRLAADREVAAARDQNPLTFLPGNSSIQRHLADVLAAGSDRTVIYFDFDNFKAFNDTYGFATGDRALLMFADLLGKAAQEHHGFAGHVGGDDFVLSLAGDPAHTEPVARGLIAKFAADVESLYDPEDRTNGGIWAKDRFGQRRFMPLLGASAALLSLDADHSDLTVADLVATLARGKATAKSSGEALEVIALSSSDPTPGPWHAESNDRSAA